MGKVFRPNDSRNVDEHVFRKSEDEKKEETQI